MRALIRLHSFGRNPLCAPKLLYSTTVDNNSNSNDNKNKSSPEIAEDGEFRTLELYKKPVRTVRKQREKFVVQPPRYKKMSVTQDWPSVWPVARTFHPATVPLPMHQGKVKPHQAVPNKFGNLELMKIPNFLHLTPPAIQRHCEALRRFCTPWPEEAQRICEIDAQFPFEVMTSDYFHSTPSIRDPRARIVTLRFRLEVLQLKEQAKDKFLRLVGDRYDVSTDMVTIVTDSCPLRSQNLDYAMYIVTALYHESHNTEEWEDEKIEDDMEKYIWEKSVSPERLAELLAKMSENSEAKKAEFLNSVSPDLLKPNAIVSIDPVKKFVDATVNLHNKGEDLEAIDEYGKSVRTLMNLPQAI